MSGSCQIFVDTRHNSGDNKLYDAAKTGSSAAASVKAMQDAVKSAVKSDAQLTEIHSSKSKGYRLRLKVTQVKVANKKTTCKLEGSIVRYPPKKNHDGREGEEMVSLALSGQATATGKGKYAVVDCVTAVAEHLANKSFPVMKSDYRSRNAKWARRCKVKQK